MFTLQQMKAAHAKVKSGADFPAYVQEIKQSGLEYYEYLVTNGQTVYYGANGFQISSGPAYAEKKIAVEASSPILQHIISEHQQGKSDFPTLCQQVADAGVEKWVVDTRKMLCSYYDRSGNIILSEPIPDGSYV